MRRLFRGNRTRDELLHDLEQRRKRLMLTGDAPIWLLDALDISIDALKDASSNNRATCSDPDCTSTIHADGLCKRHYNKVNYRKRRALR